MDCFSDVSQYARATMVFESSCSEEISLEIGDVLKILNKQDHFWHYGQKLVNGVIGQFPKSFVEMVNIPNIKPNEKIMFAIKNSETHSKDLLNFNKGDIIVFENEIDESWGYGKCDHRSGPFPIAFVQRISIEQTIENDPEDKLIVRALLPMHAQQNDELSFVVDDLIYVLENINQEWAKGKVGEKIGIFPLSFTQQIGFVKNSVPKNDILKRGTEKATLSKSEGHNEAMVFTEFHAKTEFELSVSSGAMVTVLKQINNKWCKVKYKNKFGFIPISSLDPYVTDTQITKVPIHKEETQLVCKIFRPNTCTDSVILKNKKPQRSEKSATPEEIALLEQNMEIQHFPTYDKTVPDVQTVLQPSPMSLDDCETTSNENFNESKTNNFNKKSSCESSDVKDSTNIQMTSSHWRRTSLSTKVSPTQKMKIELIRSEIEEYSRLKKEIEVMYSESFDGRERVNLAENKEIVMAKLKRLQKELEDLIYVTDNIYESVDVYQQQNNSPQERLPPTPPTIEKLEEMKQKRFMQRKHVLNELINTEEDFLQDIKITINDIMKPLSLQELPMDVRIDVLFGNIEEIRDFSGSLLSSLTNYVMEHQNVGATFIKHIPQMKEVYKVYCRNHDDATLMLEKIEEDSELCNALESCLNNVKLKVNAFDLGSFLIKPVQRILKYPLLLQELLKFTDVDDTNNNYSDLIQAQKMMQEVANSINEDKRRKDLVRKYRKGSQETLSGKISRLSIHSMKKKSARISLRIGHAAGLATTETQDENFNSSSRCFKDMEHAVKDLLGNLENFASRFKECLYVEQMLCEDLLDLFVSNASITLNLLNTTKQKILEKIYRDFHDELQLRVLSPLSSLLVRFKGPQAIIEKRFDKLLDFENCQKNTEAPEKIQMAKNVYEALNQQLLDELPELCKLSIRLLHLCSAIFVELYIECQKNIEKAVVNLGKFAVVPPSFSALTASLSKLPSGSHQKIKPPKVVQVESQTSVQRNHVMNNFPPESIFVVTHPCQTNTDIDIDCCVDDLVAVLKKQDPMGNISRWFVDNGDTQGFVSANILCPYVRPTPRDSSPDNRTESSVEIVPPSVFTTNPNELYIIEQKDVSLPLDGGCSDEDEMLNDSEYGTVTQKTHYRVEYDFVARSTLELSVNRGDILTLIVAGDLEGNKEWWLMSNSVGHQGYVPSNYLIKAEYL